MLLISVILAAAAPIWAESASFYCGDTISYHMTEGVFHLNGTAADGCFVLFNNPQRHTVNITLGKFSDEGDWCSTSHVSMFATPEVTHNSYSRFVQKYCKKPDHPMLTRLSSFTLSLTPAKNNSAAVSGQFLFSQTVMVDTSRHLPVCGPQMLTGLSGRLEIHSFRGQLHDCNWLISVGEGHRVLMRVTELHVGEIENCVSTQSIGLYNGAADLTAPPDRQFCGLLKHHSDLKRQFFSSEANAGIRYFSDKENDGSFVIEWNKIQSADEDGCPKGQFYCQGGKYCVDEEKHMCSPVTPFCIDRKLRCDHISNCGLLDNSDELRCDYNHTVLTATSIGVVAIAIITILCVFYWIRKYRDRQRHKMASFQNSTRGRRSAWVTSQLDVSDSTHSNTAGSSTYHSRNQEHSSEEPSIRKISLPASFHSKRRSSHCTALHRGKEYNAGRPSIDFNPLPMSFSNSTTYRF